MDSEVPVIDVARLQMREILARRWRCCWNCVNWHERIDDNGEALEQGRCTRFDARPPTEVIVVGCCDWAAAGVPF